MLKEINKKVIIVSLAILLLTIVLKMFVTFDLLDACIGIAAGTLLSILRFKMLNDSINKIVDADKEYATKVSMSGYASRYILTGICLVIAVLYTLDTFIALAVTLVVSTQIAARTVKVVDNKKEIEKKEV